MTELSPDLEIDLRGLLCPMPMVKVSQAILQVPVGGIVRAVATDAGALADIPAWANSTGRGDVLQAEQVGNEYVFMVKRLT